MSDQGIPGEAWLPGEETPPSETGSREQGLSPQAAWRGRSCVSQTHRMIPKIRPNILFPDLQQMPNH